jgi:hypothetical protein
VMVDRVYHKSGLDRPIDGSCGRRHRGWPGKFLNLQALPSNLGEGLHE